MALRRDGTCRLCGGALSVGTTAIYERQRKTVRCLDCPVAGAEGPADTAPLSAAAQPSQVEVPAQPASAEPVVEHGEAESHANRGVAGASARREHDRRRAKDEARLREKWGRLGGLAVALSDERQSTTAWARGAVGEERLGRRLDSLAPLGVVTLHDRRIPRTRANIDHMVVTSRAVWVVDAKRYRGRPVKQVEGGILRPRVEKLLVGRRDCTKLVDGALKQVGLVREVVGDVPVVGALCFVDADWPLLGGAFTTRDVHVVWPKRLSTLLLDPTGTDIDVDVATTVCRLAEHFPVA